MFSGIIEKMGRVVNIRLHQDGLYMVVKPTNGVMDVAEGESVAISGACLTVTGVMDKGFEVFISSETIERTWFENLRVDLMVNIERPLKIGDGLSGHIVLGHIDDTGVVKQVINSGSLRELIIQTNRELMRFIVYKGSITIDGVSLTVKETSDDNFSVVLIPYTIANTTLGHLRVGDRVNIEVDAVARYINAMVGNGKEETEERGITISFLREHGFLEEN